VLDIDVLKVATYHSRGLLQPFNPNVTSPKISKFVYVDPFAVLIGDYEIGKLVLVAPLAVCRVDEGTPIYIGNYSNMQDVVILHSLETKAHGKNIDDRRYSEKTFHAHRL